VFGLIECPPTIPQSGDRPADRHGGRSTNHPQNPPRGRPAPHPPRPSDDHCRERRGERTATDLRIENVRHCSIGYARGRCKITWGCSTAVVNPMRSDVRFFAPCHCGSKMTTDQDEPSAAERMREAQRNHEQFERQRMADPNFARMPRWVPHRPFRPTFGDLIMTCLGAIILVVVIVINLF
jgi:hypothetical protein